jgi:hypothetical protein
MFNNRFTTPNVLISPCSFKTQSSSWPYLFDRTRYYHSGPHFWVFICEIFPAVAFQLSVPSHFKMWLHLSSSLHTRHIVNQYFPASHSVSPLHASSVCEGTDFYIYFSPNHSLIQYTVSTTFSLSYILSFHVPECWHTPLTNFSPHRVIIIPSVSRNTPINKFSSFFLLCYSN